MSSHQYSLTDLARQTLIGMSAAVFVLQVLIEPSAANALCAALSGFGIVATSLYALRQSMLERSPLSILMLLGLLLCTTGGAIIVQTLSWRPLTFNLFVPEYTFAVASAYIVVALATHAGYSRSTTFQALRASLNSRIFRPLGLLAPPSRTTLWVMGAIGVAALWVAGTHAAASSIEFGDVRGKLLQALIPFAAAPFLIPFLGPLFPVHAGESRALPWPPLGIYALALGALALARNSRGSFAVVILLVLLCVGLTMLLRRVRLTSKHLAIAGIIGAISIPAFSVLSNFSTAMLITRASRDDLGPVALIRQTASVASNKAVLQHKRQIDSVIANGYNEIYVANPFLARVVIIKFLDLNLQHSRDLGSTQTKVAREVAVSRALAGLPTPILRSLGLSVDKNDLRYSSGDLYRFFASRGQLGGYTSGSSVADGLVLFGAAFWLLCPLFFIASFTFFDGLSATSHRGWLVISTFAGFQLTYIFTQSLIAESISGQLVTAARIIPQNIIIYLIIFHSCRFTERLLLKRYAPVEHPPRT